MEVSPQPESSALRDNPPPSASRKFLTPCRRLGLSRSSPASGARLHGAQTTPVRASADASPHHFKSPDQNPSPSGAYSQITKTPSRPAISKVPMRNLQKRLKSSYSNSQILPCLLEKSTGKNNPPMGKVPSEMLGKSQNENSEEKSDSVHNTHEVRDGKLNGEEITEEMVNAVKMRIKEKEERLKDLKQAEIYRRKHDPEVLQSLIERWREGCQAVLQAFHTELHERGYDSSMEDLLKQLNIPFELVKYNADTEEFE